MKGSTTRWLLGMVAAVVLTGATGCSDSTTEPKDTPEYPNQELLISGAQLEANLAAPNTVIVDVRADSVYAASHIPNAISVPVAFGGGTFDIGGTGIDRTDLRPAIELAVALGGYGINEDMTIIVYGNDIDPVSGRMFWMLEYLGATKVKMLDGGFSKWTQDGRQVSTTPKELAPAAFTPEVNASTLVAKDDLLAHYDDPAHYVIVDSRNAPDFAALRIPNAVNVLVGDYLTGDGTMKAYIEVNDLLLGKGVTRDKVVYTHCYIGYRSAQGYFVFRLLGYNVAHYDGSWADWAADENTPKESD